LTTPAGRSIRALRRHNPGPGPTHAITLTERSNSIAITPDGGTAFVANYGSDTVTPIRTVSRRAGRPIPVGKQPWAIAITPDGRTAYVVNYGPDTVTPINTSTRRRDRGFVPDPHPGRRPVRPARRATRAVDRWRHRAARGLCHLRQPLAGAQLPDPDRDRAAVGGARRLHRAGPRGARPRRRVRGPGAGRAAAADRAAVACAQPGRVRCAHSRRAAPPAAPAARRGRPGDLRDRRQRHPLHAADEAAA
jgi:YVTN family beta-propeller protein